VEEGGEVGAHPPEGAGLERPLSKRAGAELIKLKIVALAISVE